MCPKVELNGIPEFRVLASCMNVVNQKILARPGRKPQGKKKKYAEEGRQIRKVWEAAKVLGIKYVKSYSKKEIMRLVKHGMRKPSDTGARKRSYKELVSAVHARGGSEYERMKKQGRWITRRMSRVKLEALLDQRNHIHMYIYIYAHIYMLVTRT